MYEDKTLVCRECNQEFVFSAGEQEFYAERGFTNEPKCCRSCRQARKARTGAAPAREMFNAVCADCGAEFQIHFQPREDRPVYCKACFDARRN